MIRLETQTTAVDLAINPVPDLQTKMIQIQHLIEFIPTWLWRMFTKSVIRISRNKIAFIFYYHY